MRNYKFRSNNEENLRRARVFTLSEVITYSIFIKSEKLIWHTKLEDFLYQTVAKAASYVQYSKNGRVEDFCKINEENS